MNSVALSRWLSALPAGFLVLGTVGWFAVAFVTIGFGWELFVGESINSYFADHFVRTGELYRDWGDLDPYFPIYPPGFYVTAAPFELLDANAIWPGRAISTLGFVLASGSAFLTLRRLGGDVAAAVVAATAMFFITVTPLLIAGARPDGLGFGFIGLAVLAVTRWEDERRDRDLMAGAVFAATFVIIKYNFAPVAAGLAVAVLLRDRRAGVKFSAVAAGLVIAVFALFALLSSGAFITNSQDFGIGYSLDSLTTVLSALAPWDEPLLYVAIAEFALVAWLNRSLRAVHFAWLGAAVVILSSVKIGASINYAVPFAILSSILVGAALMRLQRVAPIAAALACVALAAYVAPDAIDRVRTVGTINDQLGEIADSNEEASDLLAQAPGQVFGDRNDLTIQAGKGPAFDNVPFTLLAEDVVWDTGPLVELIESGELGMIQTGFEVTPTATPEGWPPEVVSAIAANYELSWSADVASSTGAGIWLYEPIDDASPASQTESSPTDDTS